MRHAKINDVYRPSRRSSAPLPGLSRPSYSSKILALYAAEYVRDRAFAGTSGSGAWLLELTDRARQLLGPDVTYRAQTRTARRTGYVRVYLTATRKEEPNVGQP
jgi:hypothetical protein